MGAQISLSVGADETRRMYTALTYLEPLFASRRRLLLARTSRLLLIRVGGSKSTSAASNAAARGAAGAFGGSSRAWDDCIVPRSRERAVARKRERAFDELASFFFVTATALLCSCSSPIPASWTFGYTLQA